MWSSTSRYSVATTSFAAPFCSRSLISASRRASRVIPQLETRIVEHRWQQPLRRLRIELNQPVVSQPPGLVAVFCVSNEPLQALSAERLRPAFSSRSAIVSKAPRSQLIASGLASSIAPRIGISASAPADCSFLIASAASRCPSPLGPTRLIVAVRSAISAAAAQPGAEARHSRNRAAARETDRGTCHRWMRSCGRDFGANPCGAIVRRPAPARNPAVSAVS